MKRLITSYEYGQTFPSPILVKDFQDKITNDNINNITYGPNIDRSYEFEMDLDNSEWTLQQMGGIKMDNWVKQFIEALKYEQIEKIADINIENVPEEENDITAEINVNDLPVVIWNEEEYRVLFNDDGTAEILNDFGNHIMKLEGTSIDDINRQLSDKQIVTSKHRLNNNLKVLKRLANEISDDLLNVKQEYARYENFNEDEFDAKMLDYNNMIDSINLTMNQIEKEHNSKLMKEDKENCIKLNEDDSEKFKDTICPNCNKDNLVKTENNKEYQYISCENCNSIYKVDLNTGEIFYVGDNDDNN